MKEIFLNLVFLYMMGSVWMYEKAEKISFLQAKQIEQAGNDVSRVFQTASSPIFRLDESGRFLFCNKVLS
jgi:hypothetical protein